MQVLDQYPLRIQVLVDLVNDDIFDWNSFKVFNKNQLIVSPISMHFSIFDSIVWFGLASESLKDSELSKYIAATRGEYIVVSVN